MNRARALKNSSAWGLRCMASPSFLVGGYLRGLNHSRPLTDFRFDVGIGCVEVLGHGLEPQRCELFRHVLRMEDFRDRLIDSLERRPWRAGGRKHRVTHVD